MSETDDTDELLITQPHFGTNIDLDCHFDDFGPYYNVVDNLITQVNLLENRIDFLQSSSEFSQSLVSTPDIMQNSPSRLRRFNSHEDLPPKAYPTSTQSTPQKPRTKFTMGSLPNSPDRSQISPRNYKPKTPKENNPMLGEIDNFISNVKYIKRLNTVRNLSTEFKHNGDNSEHSTLNMQEVEQMLSDMDNQNKKLENRLKQKENDLNKIVKEKSWKIGDSIDSVPDFNLGMRKTMYQENKLISNDGSPDLKLLSGDKIDSDSSSESTQITALDKFRYPNGKETVKDQIKSSYDLGLVSLSKLWNSKDELEYPQKFQQKLQEERLRRQHCESTIQELQNRVLELQERISVAIGVDEAKDKALLRLHSSCENANRRFETIDKDREHLEEEMERVQKMMAKEIEENTQKMSLYQEEASKAIDSSRSNQEKAAYFEKQNADLQHTLRVTEIKSEEMNRKYSAELEKNKQYSEIIAFKELELNENKHILADARSEVANSRNAIEACQAEIASMKKENETLQHNLEVQEEAVKKLSIEKFHILEEINTHKTITNGLTNELGKMKEQLDNNKVELKHYYQGQVEMVVQNKLKDFQKQLDDAEKGLKDQLAKKELYIAKMAATHIQKISEKHGIEINLMEEKHQEECRLYQLKLSQLQHEIEDSNNKVKRQQEKHLQIERQLNKFMESLRQDNVTTVDELNSFRAKSYTNLEDILGLNGLEDERNKKVQDGTEKNSQLTYRIGDTVMGSRNERNSRKKEASLQETIQMLLEKKGQGDGRGYEEAQHLVSKDAKLSKDGRGKNAWK